MGSLQEYHPDIYFLNNNEFYEFSNTTPPVWGAHRLQGSANMLGGLTPFCVSADMADGMASFCVPPSVIPQESFNIGSSYEALVPNNLSYGGYYCDQPFEMKKLEAYTEFPSFESDYRANSIFPLMDHHPQLSNNSSDDWGCKVHEEVVPAMEEQSTKVGKYSAEERKDRILRYLKKRTQRNFNKTIKYACRKTLADKRVRVRGRFARNNETLSDGGDKEISTLSNHGEEKEFYDDDILKIKYDEEEWLQEAMASLVYFPYVN